MVWFRETVAGSGRVVAIFVQVRQEWTDWHQRRGEDGLKSRDADAEERSKSFVLLAESVFFL